MLRGWLEELDAGKLVEDLQKLKAEPLIAAMQQYDHRAARSYVLHGDDQLRGYEASGFARLTVAMPVFSVGAQDLTITKSQIESSLFREKSFPPKMSKVWMFLWQV